MNDASRPTRISASASPNPTAEAPSPIFWAPGAEDNGLAVMLGTLVRQNLQAKPNKRPDFDALHGRVAIVADDIDVALTLHFERGGKLTIHDGIAGIPDVTVRGPSEAIVALSNIPLTRRFHLPIPRRGDTVAIDAVRTLFRAIGQRSLHVYGAVLHPSLVMKLTSVMSVNG